MEVQEVANELVALMRAVKFAEAMERFYGDDIVNIEAMGGDHGITRGIAAVRAGSKEFSELHEIHGVEVTDPLVCRDEFAVTLRIDMNLSCNLQKTFVNSISQV